MKKLKLYGTKLKASTKDKTISGLLAPYEEQGSTSLGPVTIEPGALDIPQNPEEMVLNLEHDDTRPIGRGAEIEESPEGIRALFRILDTQAGRDALTEAMEGLRNGLSVEIDDPVIENQRLKAGRLTGAALVTIPAYPSAGVESLTAALRKDDTMITTIKETKETTEETPVEELNQVPEENSVPVESDPVVELDENGNPIIKENPEEEGEENMTDEEEEKKKAAITASAPRGSRLSARAKTKDMSLQGMSRLLARAMFERDPKLMSQAAEEIGKAGRLFASFTDIPYNSGGAAGTVMTQPAWLSELWSLSAYERKVVPLLAHQDLTAMTVKGWRWKDKPTMGKWSGNKTEIPSNPATTEPVEKDAIRLAGGNDIAREYRDFNVPEFWEGYFNAMAESYAILSDTYVTETLIKDSTVITPGTVPTNVPKALTFTVDAALSFIDKASPSFALVAPNLWRDLVLTPRDHTTEFLDKAFGLKEGTMEGFTFVPVSTMPKDSVLVGARDAATVYELSGSPLRVEALDILRGGLDEGLFGYICALTHDPAGIAFVGTKPSKYTMIDAPAGSGTGA